MQFCCGCLSLWGCQRGFPSSPVLWSRFPAEIQPRSQCDFHYLTDSGMFLLCVLYGSPKKESFQAQFFYIHCLQRYATFINSGSWIFTLWVKNANIHNKDALKRSQPMHLSLQVSRWGTTGRICSHKWSLFIQKE